MNEKPVSFSNHPETKIIVNFAFKTRAGSLPGNIFCQMKESAFYAICDGHGVNGHLVSGFVKEMLPSLYFTF